MALRKVGVALIGVFGAAMEEMQVSLTLVLVFFIILLTTVQRPYGEGKRGKLLQQSEVVALSLLFINLWVASIFSVYPRCEVHEGGESLWWCELISVVVGLADVVLVVALILLFVLLKGSAAKCCVNRLGRGIRGWIQAHQEEAVLDEVVEGKSTTTVNPVAKQHRRIEMSEFRSDLPSGWTVEYTEDGTAYYVDPEGNSFWDLQVGMKNSQQQQEQELEQTSLPPGWVQEFDEEGEAYYIGPEDQCQWERP